MWEKLICRKKRERKSVYMCVYERESERERVRARERTCKWEIQSERKRRDTEGEKKIMLS